MAGEQVSTGPYTADGGINPLYHRGLPAYKVTPPQPQSDILRVLLIALVTLVLLYLLAAPIALALIFG